MYQKTNKYSADFYISIAIITVLFHPIFNGMLMIFFNDASVSEYLNIILNLLEFGLICFGLCLSLKKNAKIVLLCYGSGIILWILTSLCFSENVGILIGESKTIFIFCIPAFIFMNVIDNIDCLWEMLLKVSPISILCGIFYGSVRVIDEYSMWLSYQMLLPTLVTIWKIFNAKRNVFDFILCILSILTIIMKGSRGALLVIAMYALVGFWIYNCWNINNKKTTFVRGISLYEKNIVCRKNCRKKKLNILLFLLIITVLIISLQNIQSIAAFLYKIALNFGYDSRTLRVLTIDNPLQYTAGREKYIDLSIQLIKDNSIIGYGITGERIQIGKAFDALPVDFVGYYPHNYYLEIILHFGTIVGGIILMLLFFEFVIKCKEIRYYSAEGYLFVIISIYALIVSLLSGSYLTTDIFWIFIAMCTRKGDKLINKSNSCNDC